MLNTREIFESHQGNLLHKWNHYFEIYDKHFKEYVGKDVVVLEIGISQGGSIDLWKSFFGEKLIYYGIDINPGCKKFESKNINIFIGSQEDEKFLAEIKNQLPDIDVLIDDGGHTMKQQILSFEILFPKIKNNGVYLCEDTHSSYWYKFGGGMKQKGSYIEYVKNLIDVMHLWHNPVGTIIKNHGLKESIYAIHIYDSIVVIDKKVISAPFDIKAGLETIAHIPPMKQSIFERIGQFFYQTKNKLRSTFQK